ncbi:MAG: hypothetical protein K0R98_1276 [Rickettsiaceae bacterium]|jgi:hypothetical protein|nr:hypothetical protein [Rickettsiaceae bacterium]
MTKNNQYKTPSANPDSFYKSVEGILSDKNSKISQQAINEIKEIFVGEERQDDVWRLLLDVKPFSPVSGYHTRKAAPKIEPEKTQWQETMQRKRDKYSMRSFCSLV